MNDKSTSLFKYDSLQKDSKKCNAKQKRKTQISKCTESIQFENSGNEVLHNNTKNYEVRSSVCEHYSFNEGAFSSKEADFCGIPVTMINRFLDDLSYIDDIIENDGAFNQSEEMFISQSATPIRINRFSVFDKKVIAQIHESSFQAEFNGAVDNVSLVNNLIFSTSLMNSSKWKEEHIDMCSADISEIQSLDDLSDQNLFHFNLSFSENRHSTPLKESKLHRMPEKTTDLFSSFDEDDDIQENYLETVWNSGSLHSFPVCDLFIRDKSEDEKPNFSHSILCPTEEMEEFIIETSTDVILDNSCEALMQTLNQPERQHSVSSHIGEGIHSASSHAFTQRIKDSYKDKLMEGLPKKVPPFKTSSTKNVTESPQKDVKTQSEVFISFGTNNDRRDNTTTKIMTSDSSVDVADYLENKLSVAESLWSSQKPRKKGAKHAFRTNGQSHLDGPSTNSLKNERHNVIITPFDKDTDHFVNSDQHDKKTIDIVKTKQNDKKTRINSRPFTCFSGDELLKNVSTCSPTPSSRSIGGAAECSSHVVKRRLKKLKKFCSLDRLSGFEEDSGENLKKNCRKWRSRDDLDLLNPASTLKVDNFLWWPLIGIVVFAGFVAFCFREKISIMIASKFPFENPPI